jgi:hypothetical protein
MLLIGQRKVRIYEVIGRSLCCNAADDGGEARLGVLQNCVALERGHTLYVKDMVVKAFAGLKEVL